MTGQEAPRPEEEEAALWVARHLSKAVDATAFQQWLAGRDGRRELFDALWATCMDHAVTDALQAKDDAAAQRQATVPRPVSRRVAFAVAAGVAALAAVWAWPELRFAVAPEQTFATSAGEVRNIALSDGTTLFLNGNTRLRVKIDSGRREVQLAAGEALFDVQHDPQRPFTVVTDDARVTVLGTRFDLALNDARVDLEVERGLVRFASTSERQSAVLVPARHGAALVDGRIGSPVALKDSAATEWRTGWLQAGDMTLADIVPRLQRWTDKDIIAQDPQLLRTRAAGRFRLSEPRILLDSLGDLYGFSVEETGSAFILRKR